jgi:ribosomal protein S28E/S33
MLRGNDKARFVSYRNKLLLPDQVPNFGDGLILPVAIEVLNRHECAREHAVNVKGPVQMIDLVLQNSCIPARRMNDLGLTAVVETFHGDISRPRHHCSETIQAQAAFKEFDR